jgi:hypothetical protein
VTAGPALRQVVLLTGDLPASLAATREFLGLNPGVRDEAGMAALGFEHEVLAIDETFVEIVQPLSADSSSGRLLARRGESGYMVVVQVPSLADVVDRGAELDLKPIMHTVFEGNPISQWHPRDLGTLAEIDEMQSGADWHFCPELSDTGSTAVVQDIVAVEVAVPDPPAMARRWATLLALPLADGTTVLEVGGRELRFVPGDGGVVAVRLAGFAPAARTLCGVRFEIEETR